MFKFLVWHVLVVATSCELFTEESGYSVEYAPTYHNYKPRDYHFNYAVSDPHTGDHKSQWEVKENGVVRGAYSLLEPDGTTRLVEYIADHDGFRAVVNKLGTAIHTEVPVPAVPHYTAYDGRISNYANVVVPPVLYQTEQLLGTHNGVVAQAVPQTVISQGHGDGLIQGQNLGGAVIQEQNLGQIEASLGRAEAVPVLQGHNLGRIDAGLGRIDMVPLVQGQSGSIEVGLGAGEIEHLRRIDAVPLQGHNLRHIQADLGRVEAVPLQGYNLGGIEARHEAVPLLQNQNLGRIDVLQGQNLGINNFGGVDSGLGRAEAVPLLQNQNLGRIDVLQGQNLGINHFGGVDPGLGRAEAVPLLQNQYLGRIDGGLGRIDVLQGQNVGIIDNLGNLDRAEAVALQQNHNLGRIDNLGRIEVLQGQNSRGVESGLGRVEAVPFAQNQNFGRIDGSFGRNDDRQIHDLAIIDNLGNVGSNLGRLNNLERIEGSLGLGRVPQDKLERYEQNLHRVEAVRLPQPQIEIHASQPLEVPAAPGQVPVGPSYRTVTQYHGLTGNPEDDSRYTKDVYHASYSENVPKVVRPPTKRTKPTKKEFLIVYPDSESH